MLIKHHMLHFVPILDQSQESRGLNLPRKAMCVTSCASFLTSGKNSEGCMCVCVCACLVGWLGGWWFKVVFGLLRCKTMSQATNICQGKHNMFNRCHGLSCLYLSTFSENQFKHTTPHNYQSPTVCTQRARTIVATTTQHIQGNVFLESVLSIRVVGTLHGTSQMIRSVHINVHTLNSL